MSTGNNSSDNNIDSFLESKRNELRAVSNSVKEKMDSLYSNSNSIASDKLSTYFYK